MKQLIEAYRGRKVLVTGGLGFIGSILAARLADLGSEVDVVDSLIPGQGGNHHNLEGYSSRIGVHILDIKHGDLMAHLVGGRDYIFNLAAYTSHVKSIEEPIVDLEVNCESHLSLLNTIREINPECRVVYSGSRSQYGKALYLPVDEEHPFNAVDINGVHMATVELYHRLYHRIYNIRSCCLRLTNVFGPHHQMMHSKQGFLHWFIRLALDGGEINVFGDGEQYRDFVYVDDAVRAILLAGANPDCYGDAFNVGTGKPISVAECARLVAEKAGGSYRLIPFPRDYLDVEVGDFYLDWQKINRSVGWEPVVEFDEGLDLTVDFYRRNRSKYWEPADPGSSE